MDTTIERPPSWRDVVGLLLLAGALGAFVAWSRSGWQWAVEVAQIESGLVRYPAGSAMPMLTGHVWSLVSQLAGLGMLAGVSGRSMSITLSTVIGTLSLQAIALLIFGLSRSVRVSVATMGAAAIVGSVDLGVMYPIALYETPHTFGALGLSWAVLCVGCLACGWTRLAALGAGLAFGIHAATGVWLALFLAAAATWNWTTAVGLWRLAHRWLLLGVAVSALGLTVHLWHRAAVPQLDQATAMRYFEAFVSEWDGHRQALRVWAPGVAINCLVGVLAIQALRTLRLDQYARFALATLAAGSVIALSLSTLTLLPPSDIPSIIVSAMPARLLNVAIFAAVPVLIGTLAAAGMGRSLTLTTALLVVTALGAILEPFSRDSAFGRLFQEHHGLAIAAALAIGAVGLRLRSSAFNPPDAPHGPRHTLMAGLAFALSALTLISLPHRQPDAGFGHGDDAVFQAAAEREGVLAAGANLWLIQLRTDRPVLLDVVTLDTLPYSIGAAPVVDRILMDVYGFSILARPASAAQGRRLPTESLRASWQRLTTADWQRIRRTFGVTDVIASRDWDLALPEIARGESLRLFAVP